MGRTTHMMIDTSRRDRALGVACLIGCPLMSGLFLGLVAVVCVSPAGGGDVFRLGALVGIVAFTANAFAICLTASTIHHNAVGRARGAARCAFEVTRLTSPPAARYSLRQRHHYGPWRIEELSGRSS